MNDFLEIGEIKIKEEVVSEAKLNDSTRHYLDKLNAEERLDFIAALCTNFNGYREVTNIIFLLREVWAIAAYPLINTAAPGEAARAGAGEAAERRNNEVG